MGHSCPRFDPRVFNVVHIAVSFLILFSADFTVTNMQKTINSSISEEKPEYTIDGYLTLCLLYGLYGITLWLAPSVIALIGYKFSLVIGGACLAFFIFSLTLEEVWTTYLGILLGGCGGSFLWVAQGNYVVLNSNSETMSRNTGIFWAIYAASMISGNVYAATQFEGKVHIDIETRHKLLYIMGTAAVIACVGFALLRKPPDMKEVKTEGAVEALKKTWQLFCTRDMMVLIITFIYVGLQQSFGSGVYSPSLGFTKEFGLKAKQLVPISGLLNGVGDSLGGVLYMIFLKTGLKYSRRHIIIFGIFIQITSYICIYINIPNNAVFGETEDKAIINSQIWLALLCSFVIGIGDSCLNTQIFPILRDLHPDYSSHTCSLYKFSKSMTMAVSFFFTSYMGLHLQLSIMIAFGILGAIAFSYVDKRVNRALEEESKKVADP